LQANRQAPGRPGTIVNLVPAQIGRDSGAGHSLESRILDACTEYSVCRSYSYGHHTVNVNCCRGQGECEWIETPPPPDVRFLLVEFGQALVKQVPTYMS
jgi:hypothetical protein